ncbi:MAG: hypothetical protein IPK83_05830 [Planctomycetes bacterium]|nr:hypothetical protein [Planctomycetota bacterium]
MKISFTLFAIVDLLLLALTAAMGLLVDAQQGYTRHVLLGVLAALFTCFVHVVLFMYFVVQDKIITQSIQHHDLDAAFSHRIRRMKSVALRWSMCGIAAILLTAALGASIDTGISIGLHQVAAFSAMIIEAIAFYFQLVLLGDYQDLFKDAFGEE